MLRISVLAVGLLLVTVINASSKEKEDESHASRTGHKLLSLQDTEIISSSRNSAMVQPREASEELEVPIGRKKVKIKIKKKHKKMLMKLAMTGILIKSALLPLAVGALKLLTAKAFMITMMALGLALAITFRSAKEKHVTTEIINLVPKKKHRSLTEDLPRFMEMLQYNSTASTS